MENNKCRGSEQFSTFLENEQPSRFHRSTNQNSVVFDQKYLRVYILVSMLTVQMQPALTVAKWEIEWLINSEYTLFSSHANNNTASSLNTEEYKNNKKHEIPHTKKLYYFLDIEDILKKGEKTFIFNLKRVFCLPYYYVENSFYTLGILVLVENTKRSTVI